MYATAKAENITFLPSLKSLNQNTKDNTKKKIIKEWGLHTDMQISHFLNSGLTEKGIRSFSRSKELAAINSTCYELSMKWFFTFEVKGCLGCTDKGNTDILSCHLGHLRGKTGHLLNFMRILYVLPKAPPPGCIIVIIMILKIRLVIDS